MTTPDFYTPDFYMLAQKINTKLKINKQEQINVYSVDQQIENIEILGGKETLKFKQCQLFQKCEGKGNNITSNGIRHSVLDSCPIFNAIEGEKVLKQNIFGSFTESNVEIDESNTELYLSDTINLNN
ncbi:hypothetical protein BpHYR1_017836 [Brachionus plicatilis]|uniref:Uncharacterized protein n=1 Tax=Brachionus plicatilis TaxID=10195 RepID=A0A3M7PT23_BRAPC|nr:hypothetical protein BpHYR1_017836 [Brachionus plicatilis]